MDRRSFLRHGGAAVAAATVLPLASCEVDRDRDERRPVPPPDPFETRPPGRFGSWEEVRREFNLSPGKVHLSALLIASHPRQVREAIQRYREGLDADPVEFLEANQSPRRREVRRAAASYMGTSADQIALTESTTMGLGMIYNGLRLEEGDEVLTTEHDYYATHEALRQAAERSGATVRDVALHDGAAGASVDEIVSRLRAAITPRTRLVALTWVHSSTGLKLPTAEVSAAVREAGREIGNGPILIGVDGVHGFGVEDVGVGDLGCDFFMAGAHKWLFAPRGTGIAWATSDAWATTHPSIPTFAEDPSWDAWSRGREITSPNNATRMSRGGFKAFEHQWAMAEAFAFHEAIGKAQVQERTHALAGHMKDGLAEMDHVILVTPRDTRLSSGIVCFDVRGRSTSGTVRRLRDQGIMASQTPYAEPHSRFTPCIYNTTAEVDQALEAIRAMG